METNYESFREALMSRKDDTPYAIELHTNPDPDAIAAGLFCENECVKEGITADITYSGGLLRPETQVLIKRLGVQLKSHEQVSPEDYGAFVFVDHSGGTSPWYREGLVKDEDLVAVVDHHDMDKKAPEAAYVHKEAVGSASTLFAEYLKSGASKGVDDDKMRQLSTAMMYGIRTDTKQLKRNATKRDFDAHSYLQPFADMNLINELEDFEWTSSWVDYMAKAMGGREVKDGIVIASAGLMSADEREVLPEISSKLVNVKGVHTAYALGISPEHIDVSIRTRDETFPFNTLSETFAPGTGGGRDGAGGLKIPNPFYQSFIDKAEPEILENLLLAEFKTRVWGEE
jgi:nanoRNase/pAp phosphatase (c-di-AMP/oligoRNAs hydrolase)